MAITRKGVGAVVAALALGAALLAGCGEDGAPPMAPGELTHHRTQPQQSTTAVVEASPGVSPSPAHRA